MSLAIAQGERNRQASPPTPKPWPEVCRRNRPLTETCMRHQTRNLTPSTPTLRADPYLPVSSRGQRALELFELLPPSFSESRNRGRGLFAILPSEQKMMVTKTAVLKMLMCVATDS